MMIVVSVGCGLGNQMFCFAFFEHLRSLYPDRQVKIDASHAFPPAHNGIELFEIFNLEADYATYEEVNHLTKGIGLNGDGFDNESFYRKLRRKMKLYPGTMKVQNDFTAFYSDFLSCDLEDDIYFYGVFANYGYFKNIEQKIKKMYCFPEINDARNMKYMEKIKKSNSVSIHVRRGDYVSGGIELTSDQFYQKAIEIMNGNVDNAHFFVFSDDEEYVRSLFGDKSNFTIIQGNKGKQSFRDMQLMSLCKHNIVANSTFSFWGAFLNNNADKIVIGPNLAFSGCKYPFACDDWLLI